MDDIIYDADGSIKGSITPCHRIQTLSFSEFIE
jgi:hypothetical protein